MFSLRSSKEAHLATQARIFIRESLVFVQVLLCSLILFFSAFTSFAQTSNGDGDWDTGSTWVGGTSPFTYSASITVNHVVTRTGAGWDLNGGGTFNINSGGDLSLDGNSSMGGGATWNVNSGGELYVNGDFNVTGGDQFNIYGTLRITGNLTLSSYMRIYPGGSVIVESSVTISNDQYLTIGDGSTPEPYADMTVMGDMISSNSGDVLVNQDGRLAIYGEFTAGPSGGTSLTIEDGGQVYVEEGLSFAGGGDAIDNKNTDTDYIGLYVGDGGTVEFSGGGSGFVGGEGLDTQSGSNSGYTTASNMGTDNSDFLDHVADLEDSPLPVELIYFDIKSTNQGVVLYWQTLSELNNDFFTIHRSTDGVNFQEIAQISGQGTVNETSQYSHTDAIQSPGIYYYKLEQTDFDGQNEFFETKIIEIKTGTAQQLSVYPIPASSQADFYLSNLGKNQVTSAVLYDLSGAQSQLISFEMEPNRVKLKVSELAMTPGIYLLQIYMNQTQYTQRVILN